MKNEPQQPLRQPSQQPKSFQQHGRHQSQPHQMTQNAELNSMNSSTKPIARSSWYTPLPVMELWIRFQPDDEGGEPMPIPPTMPNVNSPHALHSVTLGEEQRSGLRRPDVSPPLIDSSSSCTCAGATIAMSSGVWL